MAEIFYRLILKEWRLTNKAKEKALVRFLINEFNFSAEKAAFVLKYSPAILGHVKARSSRDSIMEHLRGFNAECMVQKIVKDKRLPFLIDKKQLKLISKEFSKTLRACVETIVFYVTISSTGNTELLPSLLVKEDEIDETFRDSDSFFVIDDTSFILLGFASDRAGAGIVIDKIIKCMKLKIDNKVVTRIGFSIIPEDGKSFYELIQVARKKIMTFENDKFSPSKIKEDKPHAPMSIKKEGAASDLQIFNLCFNKARGKFFNELIRLSPDVLWCALSKISISGQKKFVLRLPFNSPLIPFLAEKIKNQSSSNDYETARIKVIKLVSKMELLGNLKDRNENFKEISVGLNRLESIFAMPSIALQVYNVASDPESNIEDIVDIVLLDPSLSIKLLKIVNSPFYGLPEKVGSIKEAVLMLGREEVVNMAFGLSLSKSFLDSDLKGIIEPRWLWRHSLGTAIISKYLCGKVEIFDHITVFTAALIHDLGKIFLIENFPELYIKVIEEARRNNLLEISMEEELTGFDHAAIGRRIAENWNLPDALVQAVAFHHRPSSSADHSKMAAIVGFADYLSHMALEEDKKIELTQLFKLDHTIVLKKIFKDFDDHFIENSLQDALTILEENQDIFSIAE